jgi:hypothetical protein
VLLEDESLDGFELVEPDGFELVDPDGFELVEPDEDGEVDDVSLPDGDVEPELLLPMFPDEPLVSLPVEPVVADVSLPELPEVPELPDVPLPELEPDVPLWPVVVDGELPLPPLCELPEPLVDCANAPAAAIEPAARIVAANLPSFIAASLVDGDGDHRSVRCLRFSTVRNEIPPAARCPGEALGCAR